MHRPNIVIVMADDMGYGDPGCYNPASMIPTPHIDRLAAEGTLFTDAHSPGALCTPTRYGLLTGRYCWRSPKGHALVMPYEPPIIEPGRTTLASMLKDRGYTTACVGKWHLGHLYPARADVAGPYTSNEEEIDFDKPLEGGPNRLGFDSFFGTAGCSTSDAPYCFIDDDRTVGVPSVPTPEALNRLPGFYPGLMVPDWSEADVDIALARKAAAVVRELAAGTPEDPFFLYVALSAPHNPWVVPDFLRGVSGDGPRGDMCALADWCLGQVIAALEEQGCLDDTLLIYTSDHGPQYHTGEAGHRATGPFRGRKNTAFEGGHRIPFVARWPGRVAAGACSEEPICLTDLMATLAAITGEPMPDGAGEDSLDVLPALLGMPLPPRPALVTDTGDRGEGLGDFAIRAGRWKLIVMAPRDGGGSERLLFDLDADPHEADDLYDRFPDVAAGLERLLARVRERGLRSLAA